MANETVIGFDFGMSRIGVAVGQTITRTASPLLVLKARDGVPDWDAVGTLLGEWKPARAVVGLPLNMDGSTSDMSALAEKFGRKLHGRFGIKVEMMDERLSSIEARQMTGEHDASVAIDAVAACVILESWLEGQTG